MDELDRGARNRADKLPAEAPMLTNCSGGTRRRNRGV